MGLNLGEDEDKLFSQSDVRETPAASGVVNTAVAGEGIDIAGTADITISGEDSTAGNKGIIIVAPGEGMNVAYAGGTATVSGEDATTANKGIASFNTDDFTVAAGAVSLKNKTSYLSIPGSAFQQDAGATIARDGDSLDNETGGIVDVFCAVSLPHGAVITGVVVYGSDVTDTWLFRRATLNADGAVTKATAAVNTEDTSITDPTVDNQTYSYLLALEMNDNSYLYGARVTYTTDYI